MSSPPPHDIDLARASMLALILETLNMGVFFVLFSATIYTVRRREKYKGNGLLLPTLCTILFLSTTHWVIDIVRVINAFFNTPEGPLAYYTDVGDSLNLAKNAAYVTVTLIGDFFMIYRTFVVWNRRWVIVALPILLWFGTAAAGYASTILLAKAAGNGIFFDELRPWGTSFFTLSLVVNLSSTFLIALRIIQSQTALQRMEMYNSRVYSALMIFVESAAIYSTSLFILLVLYVTSSNAQYVMLDVTTSLIGVAFSLIILRLAGNETPAPGNSNSFHGTGSANAGGYRLGGRSALTADPTRTYPLTAINVSTLVETRTEPDGKEKYGGSDV